VSGPEAASGGSSTLTPARAAVKALRVISFTAAVIPILLGAVLAIGARESRWAYLPLALLAGILLQAGTNVINDVYDYKNGVDSAETLGDSGVFVSGALSTRQGEAYGLALFGAAALIGVVLAFLRGPGVLVFGAIGLLGGYLYTGGPKGYKYLALGDVAVFLLMGPLMVLGTYYVLTGEAWTARVVLASLPVGFLVAAILEANNLRDLESDRKAGVRTVSGLLGFGGARLELVVSIAAAYLVVVVLAVAGTLAWPALLVLVTAPMAFGLIRLVMSAPKPSSRRLAVAMPKTAFLHMAFGAAFVVGVGLGALT
jgi:1,4-dihydroxy-2-naphthoate octaprenyltransferase